MKGSLRVMMKRIIIVAALAMLVSVGSAGAYDGMLEYGGSVLWSGGTNVVMVDSIAYYTVFNGLIVLDVSDPSSVDTLSMVYLYGGWPSDIRVVGGYAYVTVLDDILYVIDITNPAAAYIAGSLTVEGAFGVDVAGELAYVAYTKGGVEQGLLILNVANPQQMERVGFISTDHPALKVRVQGNYAYVVDGDLWIFDVSDPALPSLASHFPTGYGPIDLDIRGDLLFLADQDPVWPAEQSAFTILDVSDKEAPFIAGRIPLWGECTDVVAVNDSVALLTNTEFVRTVDYSDPAHPDTVGKYEMPGSAGRFAASGDLMMVLDFAEPNADGIGMPGSDDQHFVDVSDPAHPQRVGNLVVPLEVTNVVAGGDYAYALSFYDSTANVKAVYVGSAFPKAIVGSYAVTGTAEAAALLDTLLFVAGTRGLEVIDVSDPANMKFVRRFAAEEGAMNVTVAGSYAYAAMGRQGVKIFDYTGDLDEPVAAFPTGDMAIKLALYDGYLYVADRQPGGQIFNVKNPEEPFHVRTFGTAYYNCVAVSGTRLYMSYAGVQSGFNIFDLEPDPENPTYLGSYGGFIWNYEVIADRDYVAVADGWDGIRIIDVSDPTNATEVGGYNTCGFAFSLYASDGRITVADEYSLVILDNWIATDTDSQNVNPIPESFHLSQNYPNPFNATTTIEFFVPRRSHVTLTVYNVLGRKVTTLMDAELRMGPHRAAWDAQDFSSGVYFYRLAAGDFSMTRKMVMIK